MGGSDPPRRRKKAAFLGEMSDARRGWFPLQTVPLSSRIIPTDKRRCLIILDGAMKERGLGRMLLCLRLCPEENEPKSEMANCNVWTMPNN